MDSGSGDIAPLNWEERSLRCGIEGGKDGAHDHGGWELTLRGA
jgi:hypothetical protein